MKNRKLKKRINKLRDFIYDLKDQISIKNEKTDEMFLIVFGLLNSKMISDKKEKKHANIATTCEEKEKSPAQTCEGTCT